MTCFPQASRSASHRRTVGAHPHAGATVEFERERYPRTHLPVPHRGAGGLRPSGRPGRQAARRRGGRTLRAPAPTRARPRRRGARPSPRLPAHHPGDLARLGPDHHDRRAQRPQVRAAPHRDARDPRAVRPHRDVARRQRRHRLRPRDGAGPATRLVRQRCRGPGRRQAVRPSRTPPGPRVGPGQGADDRGTRPGRDPPARHDGRDARGRPRQRAARPRAQAPHGGRHRARRRTARRRARGAAREGPGRDPGRARPRARVRRAHRDGPRRRRRPARRAAARHRRGSCWRSWSPRTPRTCAAS